MRTCSLNLVNIEYSREFSFIKTQEGGEDDDGEAGEEEDEEEGEWDGEEEEEEQEIIHRFLGVKFFTLQ